MKGENKRYILAEYAGYSERTYYSNEEYDELISKINKYNAKKDSKYLVGNVYYTIDKNNVYHVLFNKYNKLTSKMTISDLDDLTFKYDTQSDLILDYSNKLLTKDLSKAKLAVVYLEDKNSNEKTVDDADRGIKSIPVLYKNDAKYLSKNYLFKCMEYYINIGDYGFFLDLANNFEKSKDIEEYIEKLRITIDKVKYQSLDPKCILDVVKRLYSNYIVLRDKEGHVLRNSEGKEITSHRRKRDMVFFVKDYNIVSRKRDLPKSKYNQINHDLNNNYELLDRNEREQDFIEEEAALDAWDQGIIYRRK